MSKILRNDSGSDYVLTDVGVTVAAASSYTIPPQDYPAFAASSDTIKALADSFLILNDGGNDITELSKAVDILKGWPVQTGTTTTDSPFFFDYAGIPPSGPEVIYSQSIDPGVTLLLNRIYIACRMESMLQVYVDGAAIAFLRTGAAFPMASFDWKDGRSCESGSTLTIVLTKRDGAPDIDVGVHLMGTQQI